MPDTERHDATGRDEARQRYTLSLHDVLVRFDAAELPRTMRTLQRYCESGRLDCLKTETPTGDAYVVDPQSVDRAIGELKLIHGDRHDATGRDISEPVALATEPKDLADAPRHDATSRDMSQPESEGTPDRQVATQPDMTRPVATDRDIYEHPYVKRVNAGAKLHRRAGGIMHRS